MESAYLLVLLCQHPFSFCDIGFTSYYRQLTPPPPSLDVRPLSILRRGDGHSGDAAAGRSRLGGHLLRRSGGAGGTSSWSRGDRGGRGLLQSRLGGHRQTVSRGRGAMTNYRSSDRLWVGGCIWIRGERMGDFELIGQVMDGNQAYAVVVWVRM